MGQQFPALPDADEPARKSILPKSGELIADLLKDELPTVTTETTVELNPAVLKIKHSVTKSGRTEEANQQTGKRTYRITHTPLKR